jgi:hypothetical protein
MFHGLDVNIGIASAITSYARVFMSAFKNNKLFNLYYSDTDSIVIDSKLPDNIVGNELGQVKLEYTVEKAVFLAPKVYGLITTDGEEVVKVKGLSKNKIKFNDMSALLQKDSNREYTQEKWVKSILEGTVGIQDQVYTLKVTSNKRELIYNENNILFDTRPFNY